MILYTLRGALNASLQDALKELSAVPGLTEIKAEEEVGAIPTPDLAVVDYPRQDQDFSPQEDGQDAPSLADRESELHEVLGEAIEKPKNTRTRSKISLNDFEKAFATLTLAMGGMDKARSWLRGATGKYATLKAVPAADRDKVYEMIQARAAKQEAPAPAPAPEPKEIAFEDLLDQYVNTFSERVGEASQLLEFFGIEKFGLLPKERYQECSEWMTRFSAA